MKDPVAETIDIVKKAKKLGADEAIARTTLGKYRQIRFSNNQIDTTVAWNDYTTDLALAWKKRLVATQIHDFEYNDSSIKRILDLAKIARENPFFGGFAEGHFKYVENNADTKLRELEDPAGYVFEAIDAAQKEAGSKSNSGGILFTKFEEVYLHSSEGPQGTDDRSAIELSIRVFTEPEASGHGVECASTLKKFKPSKAGTKAGEIAELARKPSAGEEGTYNVIFDPLIFGSFLALWGGMASAYSVLAQMSIFVDKIDRQVAPREITMRDNPAAYSMSNRAFDDEGSPAKENIIIEHGILKTYLHNTSTATIFKTRTTGNAGLILPNAWNIEMDPGRMKKDELFKETKRGLYLTNTWYTRFQNHSKGDFSTIPRDGIFLVEKGEIKKSLKDLRISDNALNILRNISEVSAERQHIHWWGEADPPSLSPFALVKNVNLTKSR